MTLKLYVDMMSQPCRALVMFMKLSGISFNVVPIAIRKGEHKQEPYLKINPLGKVPTLADDNFLLTERYLCSKYSVPDNLYPKDLRQRARVDEYLEWQHMNTRFQAGRVFINEVILRKDATRFVGDLNTMLDELDMMFLRNKSFLAGEQVSFADILAACELMQPTMSGRDVLAGRPKLQQWMERVQTETQPFFDEAHQVFYRSKDKLKNRL